MPQEPTWIQKATLKRRKTIFGKTSHDSRINSSTRKRRKVKSYMARTSSSRSACSQALPVVFFWFLCMDLLFAVLFINLCVTGILDDHGWFRDIVAVKPLASLYPLAPLAKLLPATLPK
uniref:Uncharacterized protein n=1 Tax=Leersia perrieri TaxID=77586 RepID=A0A0D9V0Y9_9ORYZ